MYEQNEEIQAKELHQEEMKRIQGGFCIWNGNKCAPDPDNVLRSGPNVTGLLDLETLEGMGF